MISYPLETSYGFTRVIEQGPANGTSVLLVHGVGARADRWRLTIPALAAQGFRAIAFDLPGHGFASKARHLPHTVPTFGRVVEDTVAAYLQAGSLGKPILIGTSLGGHIVGAAAVSLADRIQKVVLVGSMGLEPMGESGPQMAQRLQDMSLMAVDARLRRLVYDQSLVTDEWIYEEHRINTSPGAREYFAKLGRYLAGPIDADTLGTSFHATAKKVPVTLVWGEFDQIIPLQTGKRFQSIHGGDLHVIRSAGHAPYLEQPDEFNDCILAQLSQ